VSGGVIEGGKKYVQNIRNGNIPKLYSPPAKIALFIGKVLEHSYIKSATF